MEYRDHTKEWRLRVGDHSTESLTNFVIWSRQRTVNDGLNALVFCILWMVQMECVAFHVEDRRSRAYRRCALKPDHWQFHAAVFASEGTVYVAEQKSLTFGAICSVWGFHRVGNFLLSVARRRFRLAAMRYVDDLYGLVRPGVELGPAKLCSIIFGAFGWFCDEAKTSDFKEALDVLGACVLLQWSKRAVSLSVAQDKMARQLAQIDAVLESGILVPSEAMKLVGRLSWTATLGADQCGRAFLQALHAQIHTPWKGLQSHGG